MSEKVLEAPCVFCGYNGTDYWQAGTHNADCPIGEIGGRSSREEGLRYVADVASALTGLAARVKELEGGQSREVTAFVGEALLLFGVSGDDLKGEEPGNFILRKIRELRAVVKAADAKFAHLAEYWNRSENERAMSDFCWHVIEECDGWPADAARAEVDNG